MLIEIGDVIAERSFEVIRPDGTKHTATASLGKPKQKSDSESFYAPYMIEGLGSGKPFFAGGLDAFQALQLAMKMIGAELNAFKKKYNVEIVWEGDNSGGPGFE